MDTSVLKPGLLVSLHTYVRGGVQYTRKDLERGRNEDGAEVSRWETERAILDPAEFTAASNVRAESRKIIARECLATAFGLLCPSDREFKLRAAIDEARGLVAAFNADARRCRIEMPIMLGRIAADDQEALAAVSAEARALLDEMRAGVAALDPDRIRENAAKARALAGMLSDDVARKVSLAVDEARRIATSIVKAGERAAVVVGEARTARLDAARFAFLDLGDAGEVVSAAPTARVVDLPALSDYQAAPEGEPSYAYASLSVPLFELV